MRTYVGRNHHDVFVRYPIPNAGETVEKKLPLRLDLRNHSPTGFSWGYGGSGPAQLALALLADALADDERALRLYQTFKWQVVCKWGQTWSIDQAEIRYIADVIETEIRDREAAVAVRSEARP